jgi:hypothetical protein
MIGRPDVFTREQIRGTLENFKGDKMQAKDQLIYKLRKHTLLLPSFLSNIAKLI